MESTKIIIYQSEDGKTKIQTTLENETLWLTQKNIAEVFNITVATINEHIKNIYEEKELEENPTIRNFLIVQKEGQREVKRDTKHYNLDMIIALGYRVKSTTATQFRIWATNILKEYVVKGFAMNDELLKESGGGDYFDELLARIRDIRSNDWIQRLDGFLTMTGNDILKHRGSIIHKQAIEKASKEYELYKQNIKNLSSQVEDDFIDVIERQTKTLKGK